MMTKPRRLFLLGLMMAFHVPSIASADVTVRLRATGLPGPGTYGPRILKPDELEQCVTAEKEIAANSDTLKAMEIALKRQGDELERLSREIGADASQLLRTSQVTVDSHNARIQRFQMLATDLREQIAAFNTRTTSHNIRIQQFIGNCADRNYYDSGRRALRTRFGF